MSDSSSSAWFRMSRLQLVRHLRDIADDIECGAPSGRSSFPSEVSQWTLARRAVPCLVGVASGHPRISDGKPLLSSELYYLDPERGFARTFSRWYRLGDQASPRFWDGRLYGEQ